MSTKIDPNIAKNVTMMAPLATEKRGFLKNARSSIGWSLRSSHTKNAASTTPPTAKNASVVGSVHPWSGPSMTA